MTSGPAVRECTRAGGKSAAARHPFGLPAISRLNITQRQLAPAEGLPIGSQELPRAALRPVLIRVMSGAPGPS